MPDAAIHEEDLPILATPEPTNEPRSCNKKKRSRDQALTLALRTNTKRRRVEGGHREHVRDVVFQAHEANSDSFPVAESGSGEAATSPYKIRLPKNLVVKPRNSEHQIRREQSPPSSSEAAHDDDGHGAIDPRMANGFGFGPRYEYLMTRDAKLSRVFPETYCVSGYFAQVTRWNGGPTMSKTKIASVTVKIKNITARDRQFVWYVYVNNLDNRGDRGYGLLSLKPLKDPHDDFDTEGEIVLLDKDGEAIEMHWSIGSKVEVWLLKPVRLFKKIVAKVTDLEFTIFLRVLIMDDMERFPQVRELLQDLADSRINLNPSPSPELQWTSAQNTLILA